MSKTKDDFEATREIVNILETFDSRDRERIIRWAMEKLGDSISGISSGAMTPTTQENVTASENNTSGVSSSFMDIKSFVNSKDPKNDTQLATTIAYYYAFKASDNNRKDSIGASDFLDAIRLLNRKKPSSRPLQVLSNAKNLGYLDPTGEKGRFKINSVGENLVV